MSVNQKILIPTLIPVEVWSTVHGLKYFFFTLDVNDKENNGIICREIWNQRTFNLWIIAYAFVIWRHKNCCRVNQVKKSTVHHCVSWGSRWATLWTLPISLPYYLPPYSSLLTVENLSDKTFASCDLTSSVDIYNSLLYKCRRCYVNKHFM